MSPEARQQMRDILRTALKTAVLPGATPDAPGGYHRTDAEPADLLARFTTELETVGGAVHVPPAIDADHVAALIADIAGDTASRHALLWDDAHLPVPGVANALVARGFVISRQEADAGPGPARDALATATVGVTGADAMLAETGSLVLVSGPGRGRLASLLPPIHVALVERTRLVRSLPDLLLTRPDLAEAGSNLICITGPSRTADIEHTLSRGVHGPGEVHVILV